MPNPENSRGMFACGVTLFNPEKSVINRLKQYCGVFDLVVAYDNSDAAESFDLKKELESFNNIIFLGNNHNDGLCVAFNAIIEYVIDDYDFLCTLDQDSIFPDDEILKMKGAIEGSADSIALLSPHVIYGKTKPTRSETIKAVRYAITSGSMIKLKVLRSTGVRYDTNYFIDKFEIDLCKQLQLHGFIIAEYEGAFLYQRLGEPGRMGHSSHSAIRHYYLFRNRFYFNRKYYKLPKRAVLNALQSTRQLLGIVLYENGIADKLYQIIPAYADYQAGKMGCKTAKNM